MALAGRRQDTTKGAWAPQSAYQRRSPIPDRPTRRVGQTSDSRTCHIGHGPNAEDGTRRRCTTINCAPQAITHTQSKWHTRYGPARTDPTAGSTSSPITGHRPPPKATTHTRPKPTKPQINTIHSKLETSPHRTACKLPAQTHTSPYPTHNPKTFSNQVAHSRANHNHPSHEDNLARLTQAQALTPST